MGMGHRFDTILEAASLLSHSDDIVFLFIGNGARRSEIEDYVSKKRLNNIQIKGYVPRENLNDNLNCADVSLVTLSENMVGIMIPSKLYGIMASGKPIVFIGSNECEIAHIIQQHRIGYVIEHGNVDAFIKAITDLRDSPELRSELGNRARSAFIKYYERKILTERHYNILANMVEQ
jgi:glycosyltransferase involved in cell wall biosynthesis